MRIAEVQRHAQALLDTVGARALPVDVGEVAAQLGIPVVTQPLEKGISAVLVIEGERAAIGVNRNHHPHRQRFSIAHEIAHYVLHRDSASVFVDSKLTFYRDERSADGVYQREIEANAFAAELLMPAVMIREAFQHCSVDVHDDVLLNQIAAKFKVSQQALTIRLVRLGLVQE